MHAVGLLFEELLDIHDIDINIMPFSPRYSSSFLSPLWSSPSESINGDEENTKNENRTGLMNSYHPFEKCRVHNHDEIIEYYNYNFKTISLENGTLSEYFERKFCGILNSLL